MAEGRDEALAKSGGPIQRLTAVGARVWAVSRNPLFIALAAALLGNFFIPRILDRAETNRRALDLKANLATQMGASFEAVLTQGELFARDVVKTANVDPQEAFNDAWSEWRNASGRVDAQLTAYFGADQAGKAFTGRWRDYRKAVDAIYFLSGTGLKAARCQLVEDVKAVLEPQRDIPSCREPSLLNVERKQRELCLADDARPYDLLAACDGDNTDQYGYARGQPFSMAYTDVSEKLLTRGRLLLEQLVRLTPSGF